MAQAEAARKPQVDVSTVTGIRRSVKDSALAALVVRRDRPAGERHRQPEAALEELEQSTEAAKAQAIESAPSRQNVSGAWSVPCVGECPARSRNRSSNRSATPRRAATILQYSEAALCGLLRFTSGVLQIMHHGAGAQRWSPSAGPCSGGSSAGVCPACTLENTDRATQVEAKAPRVRAAQRSGPRGCTDCQTRLPGVSTPTNPGSRLISRKSPLLRGEVSVADAARRAGVADQPVKACDGDY